MLINQNFIQSKAAPCLYTQYKKSKFIYILAYVDDLPICHEIKNNFQKIITHQNEEVEVKHLGSVNYYLRTQIKKNRKF